jgi:2-haloacid dehalogenase
MPSSSAADRTTIAIDAIVFDLGGVLLDWNPRYLYRKLFADENEMEAFLQGVCTMEWHAAHDRGLPFAQSCAALAKLHPQYAEEINAWGTRSEEMVAGQIDGTVAILDELLDRGLRCYALTNMERETYPVRRERYPFMRRFAGTVVSSTEGVAKPDPEIFQRLLKRFDLEPARTVMVDDSAANVEAAAAVGMHAVRFQSPPTLRIALARLNLLPDSSGAER